MFIGVRRGVVRVAITVEVSSDFYPGRAIGHGRKCGAHRISTSPPEFARDEIHGGLRLLDQHDSFAVHRCRSPLADKASTDGPEYDAHERECNEEFNEGCPPLWLTAYHREVPHHCSARMVEALSV